MSRLFSSRAAGTSGSRASMTFCCTSRHQLGCPPSHARPTLQCLCSVIAVHRLFSGQSEFSDCCHRTLARWRLFHICVLLNLCLLHEHHHKVIILSLNSSVCVGIKGNPPYLDHQLPKAVKSESTWTFGKIEIRLCSNPFSHANFQRMASWKSLCSKC